MSEERDTPAKTPLVDLLRRIPADAVYRWESCGELAFASYSAPIGLHAHEAASEITRLRGEVERLTALASREGWVMVPREPTFDMVRNGSIDLGCRRDCTLGATRADQVWTAMLSAAPKPEEG